MSTTDVSLRYLLFGEDRSAGKTMKGVAGEAQSTGKHFRTSVVAGAAVAGAAVVAFGKISVDKFKEVGSETLGLQRVMGGTAEEASRMRFAAHESGVTYETLAKSTGKLSKFLVAANDQISTARQKMAEAHAHGKTWNGTLGANAAALDKLDVGIRNANGSLKPMSDVLPQLADRFKEMPNGPEKTALAMKLFGKAGTDMLPFLNKGSEGIAELSKQSDKYGLTLTGKNLQALKDSKMSQREWNASLDGLRVSLGAQVLPVMTAMLTLIREHLIPVVVKVTGFFRDHTTTTKVLAGVIGGVTVLALSAYAVSMASAAVATIAATWPILAIIAAVAGLVVGIVMLWRHWDQIWGWVSNHKGLSIVIGLVLAVLAPIVLLTVAIIALGKHWSQVWGALETAFRVVVLSIVDLFGAIIHAAAAAFGWVPGIGGKLKTASKEFDQFRDSVNRSLGGIKDKKITVSATLRKQGFTAQAAASLSRGADGYATGGRPSLYEASWVGEQGRELFVPDVPGTILTHAESEMLASRGRGSDGGEARIHLYIDGREIRTTVKRQERLAGGAR